MRVLSFVLAATGVLGGVAPVLAETPVTVYEDSVVVTASASEHEADHQPSSVTVITRQELEDRQITSVAEALTQVAGAAVVSSGPPGQPTSVFLRGTDSNQTLLLWNGVALNSPDFGAVNWQFVPLDGVERIEVVRGPASALYGGNALGGVVQLLSGRIEGTRLELEGGDHSYHRGSLSVGHAFGNLQVDFNGSSRRGSSEFENSFFDSDDASTRLAWQVRPELSISLVTRVDDTDTGIPFVGNAEPALKRRISWQERSYALPVSADLGAWKLEAQLSHVDSDYHFRDPDDAFGDTRSDTSADADRLRAVATYRRNEHLQIAFGSEGERLEASDKSVFGVNLDGAHQRTWAVFTEVSGRYEGLDYSLGARRDDNDAYGAETSLRGGVGYEVVRGLRLRAGYGEAFRPPTLGELFFPGFGNPSLEPERGRNLELAAAWKRGAFSAELVGYELRQRDLIDFDPATFTFANITRARSRGAELSLAWRGAWLDLTAAGAYLEAENLDTRAALLRRPRRSASLQATAKLSPLRVTGFLRYVGPRPDVDPVSFATVNNGGCVRFDLAIKWQLLPYLAPYARVENLGDRSYQEALGFPSAGRTFALGASLGF
ncbi:MAG TPA: TonB-dependent receptor [Thermoanaerobaculia bacterium]|nr:TonB-dependent receptor [Thermoanaerobaculia bacterium]